MKNKKRHIIKTVNQEQKVTKKNSNFSLTT